MGKSQFTHRHTNAFMEFVFQMQDQNIAAGLPPETRMRLAVHLTTAFWLHIHGTEITTPTMTAATGLNSRTINIGFKHFVDVGYLASTTVKASHGKGHARLYSFTPSFISMIQARPKPTT